MDKKHLKKVFNQFVGKSVSPKRLNPLFKRIRRAAYEFGLVRFRFCEAGKGISFDTFEAQRLNIHTETRRGRTAKITHFTVG